MTAATDNLPTSKKRWTTIVAITFFVVFGLWFWRPIQAAHQAFTFRYEPHAGSITKLNLKDGQIEQIEFTYSIGGQRYFADTATRYSRHSLDDIEKETGPLKAGSTVCVYVDPHERSEAVIVRGMTTMMQFGLAWCILAAIGSVAGTIEIFQHSRTQPEFRELLDQKVEVANSGYRIRLIPGGTTDPTTAALLCFFVAFVLIFGHITLFQWIPTTMGKRPGALAVFTLWRKIGISLFVAIVCSVFDYFHTKQGNAEGRWDLRLDEQTRELQIPAISAFGKPYTLPIDDIVGLELRTLISPETSDSDIGTYRVNVICEEAEDPQENGKAKKLVRYTAAQSANQTELRAMAEWLNDFANLEMEIEESTCDNSGMEELIELACTKREVKQEPCLSS